MKSLDPSSFAQRFDDRVARYARRPTEMSEQPTDPSRFEDVVRVFAAISEGLACWTCSGRYRHRRLLKAALFDEISTSWVGDH